MGIPDEIDRYDTVTNLKETLYSLIEDLDVGVSN